MTNNTVTIAVITLNDNPLNESFLSLAMKKHFPQRAFKIVYLLQNFTRNSEPPQPASGAVDVVSLPAFPGDRRLTRFLNRWIKVISIERELRRFSEDHQSIILHIRDDWSTGLSAARAAQKLSIPVIFQFSRPGHEFHFYNANHQKNILLAAYSWLMGNAEWRGARRLMKKANYVLPISSWMKTDLEKAGISGEKMHPFPMGFDPDALEDLEPPETVRAPLGIPAAPLIVYFGTMWPGRDLEFLLRAFKIVKGSVRNAVLLMVGGEPHEMKPLQETAASIGVGPDVIFTGHVPRNKVYAFLNAADAAVSPIPPIPAFMTSSPTKLIEALGMGCPVVASDIPEQRQIIEESGGGFCVPYRETEFAEKLIQLLSDRPAAVRMGRMGQQYILENRNYKKMAAELAAFYTRIATEAGY